MQTMLAQEANTVDPSMVQPMNFDDDPVAKWELETSAQIENIRLTFLGKKMVKGNMTQVSDAIISTEGINTLLLPVQALNNKITALSNLSEEVIKFDCEQFRRVTREQLIYNRNKWNVSKSNYGVIIQTLDTLMYSALSKAQGALLLKIRRQQFITKQLITNQGSRAQPKVENI